MIVWQNNQQDYCGCQKDDDDGLTYSVEPRFKVLTQVVNHLAVLRYLLVQPLFEIWAILLTAHRQCLLEETI